MESAIKVRLLRVGGVVAMSAVTGLAATLSDRYPWLTLISSSICWLIGKALGIPVDDVIADALRHMQPSRAVALTVSAVASLPPSQLDSGQAEDLTRQLLASIPPDARARAIGPEIVFSGESEPPSPTQ